MADNYLEKKMEEHRSNAGKPAVRRRVSPTGQRAGQITLPFPETRVFVSGPDEAIVRAFASAGAKVEFCCPEPEEKKRSTALAELTGARFYPMTTEEALAKSREMSGKDPDAIVLRHTDGSITICRSDRSVTISGISGTGAEKLAVLLLTPELAEIESLRITTGV